jgi:truncated hemoglobin YjbI/plastocyanin
MDHAHVRTILLALLLGAGAVARAAAGDAEPAAKDNSGLYQLFGEKAGIVALVDDFTERMLKDERVRDRFDAAHIQHFKDMVVDQICQSLGGPCVYHGKDMRSAHLGMHITAAEYDALTADMVAALDARHIPKEAQRRFLAIRDGRREQIVDPLAGNVAPAATGAAAGDATLRRAQDLRDAARLLELANNAREQGNATLAGRLFNSAELVVGSETLADLYPSYQTAAPARVRSPLAALPPTTPPQPRTVVATEEEARQAEPTHASVSGTLVSGATRATQSLGLVTLAPLDRPARAPAPKQRTLEQRGRAFAPRLLVVPTGSTVSFPNFDPIFHSVYSSSEAKSFDLGVYRNGQSRDVTFDKPGIVHVQCNLHTNMTAHIAVVSEPYAAVADDGRFAFRALVPGRYKLRAWTETSGKMTEKTVTLRAGKNQLSVDITALTDKLGNAPR